MVGEPCMFKPRAPDVAHPLRFERRVNCTLCLELHTLPGTITAKAVSMYAEGYQDGVGSRQCMLEGITAVSAAEMQM